MTTMCKSEEISPHASSTLEACARRKPPTSVAIHSSTVVTTSVDHTATVPSVVLGSGPTQSLSGAHGISATIRTELRDSSTRHVEGAIESSVIIAVGAVYSQFDVNSVPTFFV